MTSLTHSGTRWFATLCFLATWSLLVDGCDDPSSTANAKDGSSGPADSAAKIATDGGNHDASAEAASTDGGGHDAATDAGADACVSNHADDVFACINQHCTGPLGTGASARTFVPGGNCRFVSAMGFIEGSCLNGKMHFRDQLTAGGPWIEYWDEHGKLVAEESNSDELEFCGGTAVRIVSGDAAAAAACDASRTDEHTLCSDADAGL